MFTVCAFCRPNEAESSPFKWCFCHQRSTSPCPPPLFICRVLAENRGVCLEMGRIFVQEAGEGGIPYVLLGEVIQQKCLTLGDWPRQNCIQKVKVLLLIFFTAAEGKWDKLDKGTLLFFLPIYSRGKAKQDCVGQLPLSFTPTFTEAASVPADS